MKILALIFSMYLLLLSCIPCGDADECKERLSLATSRDVPHKEHKREKDNCTPFCNCACCAVPVCIQQSITFKAVKPVFAGKEYYYIQSTFLSSGLSPVWQPPRLS